MPLNGDSSPFMKSRILPPADRCAEIIEIVALSCREGIYFSTAARRTQREMAKNGPYLNRLAQLRPSYLLRPIA